MLYVKSLSMHKRIIQYMFPVLLSYKGLRGYKGESAPAGDNGEPVHNETLYIACCGLLPNFSLCDMSSAL